MERTRHGPKYGLKSAFFRRQGNSWKDTPLGRGRIAPPPSGGIRSRARAVAKAAEYLCWILGFACLGYVVFSYGRAGIFQAYESWRFDREIQKHPPSPSHVIATPSGSSAASLPNNDAVLGRLEIPRLGLSVMVLQGDDEATFAKGAGHLPKTPLPGQAGNVVFAAHRDTFFRPLRLIRKGDELSVTTRQGVYHYRVEMIAEVAPDDVEVLGALHHPTLTLVTCYPFVFVGNAPKRFVVRAAEIDASPLGTRSHRSQCRNGGAHAEDGFTGARVPTAAETPCHLAARSTNVPR